MRTSRPRCRTCASWRSISIVSPGTMNCSTCRRRSRRASRVARYARLGHRAERGGAQGASAETARGAGLRPQALILRSGANTAFTVSATSGHPSRRPLRASSKDGGTLAHRAAKISYPRCSNPPLHCSASGALAGRCHDAIQRRAGCGPPTMRPRWSAGRRSVRAASLASSSPRDARASGQVSQACS